MQRKTESHTTSTEPIVEVLACDRQDVVTLTRALQLLAKRSIRARQLLERVAPRRRQFA